MIIIKEKTLLYKSKKMKKVLIPRNISWLDSNMLISMEEIDKSHSFCLEVVIFDGVKNHNSQAKILKVLDCNTSKYIIPKDKSNLCIILCFTN